MGISRHETQQKERQVFLDVLRVLATIAVVMMHTVSGCLNGGYDFAGWERRVKAFRALIDATSWSVPIFLIISGYLFLNPERQITWKDAIFKYCRRILFVLVLFGYSYALLELIGIVRGFEPWMITWAAWNTLRGRSWSHMWYCYLILILYAVTPLIKWFLAKVPRAVLYVIFGVLALGVSVIPYLGVMLGFATIFRIPVQGIYVFYYLIGYLWAVRKKEAKAGEGTWCLAGFCLIVLLEMASRFITGYDLDMAYGYPFTLIASLLLFNAGWALRGSVRQSAEQPKWYLRAVTFLSPLCFGIYLIHPVFLNLFYKFLKISIMDFRFYVGVPLFFLIAFVGATIATWILRKISVLKKYVL